MILRQTCPKEFAALKFDAFRRFWQKVFSVEHAIQELLRLPYSRHLGHLLNCDFEVVLVPAQFNRLQFDMEKDIEFRSVFISSEEYLEFLERYADRLRYESDLPDGRMRESAGTSTIPLTFLLRKARAEFSANLRIFLPSRAADSSIIVLDAVQQQEAWGSDMISAIRTVLRDGDTFIPET